MNDEIKAEGPLKVEWSTDDYRELAREIRELQKELDYWYKLAKSYERTILKLSLALTEGKHEDN